MRGRVWGFAGVAMLAAVCLARPAEAVTITAQADYKTSPMELLPGTTYEGASDTSGPFPAYFNFELKDAPLGTISYTVKISSTAPSVQISWLDGSDGSPLTPPMVATEFSPLQFALTVAGLYSLTIISSVPVAYLVSVTTTPLPAALLLFGTGLAGLSWLSRRRKRNNSFAHGG